MIDTDYHWERVVGSSKVLAVGRAERPPGPTPAIDPAAAALLDHIAEDLAREYVRLMEHAAQDDGTRRLPRKEEQEA